MKKGKDINVDLTGVMDDGWNVTIRKALEAGKKATAAVPAAMPAVTDPETKKLTSKQH